MNWGDWTMLSAPRSPEPRLLRAPHLNREHSPGAPRVSRPTRPTRPVFFLQITFSAQKLRHLFKAFTGGSSICTQVPGAQGAAPPQS